MKKFLLYFFLVGIIFLIFFYRLPKLEKELPLRKLEITSDKTAYFPGEFVSLAIKIDAIKKANATLMVYGIPLPSGMLLFKNITEVNLNAGKNLFTYNFSLPTCYSCVGLKSGKYKVTALASFGGGTLNSSKEINLVD